jgi:dTDP-4-amino-4,6-dideoxygalactose transaminase
MVVLGWKYNISNVEAALLLLLQLERMEAKLARRHALMGRQRAGILIYQLDRFSLGNPIAADIATTIQLIAVAISTKS